MLDDALQIAVHEPLRVLITAASREQREEYARFIHENGETRRGPFVIFQPAANPGDDPGRPIRRQFDEARGGTLFIDDIARLTPAAQRLLYRSLEACQPLPGTEQGTGVRVIAGAPRHLASECAGGAFFEPLFYRLNVIHIDLTSGVG
jgi:DNA-binding NtrC family response regulator